MAHLIPKPGDTIIITNSTLPSYQKQLVVATPPGKFHSWTSEEINSKIWVQIQNDPLLGDYKGWFYPNSCKIVMPTDGRRPVKSHIVSSEVCPDCKGTGKIQLFTSVVDCDCKTQQKTCQECSYEYCECDGKCNPDNAGSCSSCGVWACENCLMDGMCHNYFAKLQGGVI